MAKGRKKWFLAAKCTSYKKKGFGYISKMIILQMNFSRRWIFYSVCLEFYVSIHSNDAIIWIFSMTKRKFTKKRKNMKKKVLCTTCLLHNLVIRLTCNLTRDINHCWANCHTMLWHCYLNLCIAELSLISFAWNSWWITWNFHFFSHKNNIIIGIIVRQKLQKMAEFIKMLFEML